MGPNLGIQTWERNGGHVSAICRELQNKKSAFA